jgi:hypothetical protein
MNISRKYDENLRINHVYIEFGTPLLGASDFNQLRNLVNYSFRLLREIDPLTPRENIRQGTGLGMKNIVSTLQANPQFKRSHVILALQELIERGKLSGIDTCQVRCDFYIEFLSEMLYAASPTAMRNFVSETSAQ